MKSLPQSVRITLLVTAICALSFVYLKREHPELLLHGRLIEREHVLIYLPRFKTLDPHPVLITLSPVADARTMILVWADAADELGWVIVSSKEFQNGVNPTPSFESTLAAIHDLEAEFPIDQRRIVATGISGGAMGSHMLAYDYPDRIAGVILNTGMMFREHQLQAGNYPTGKFAAFEASPTDFRYGEMKGDEVFLRSRGWKTWWKEFQGGHTLAPTSLNQEALRWMDSQLRAPH